MIGRSKPRRPVAVARQAMRKDAGRAVPAPGVGGGRPNRCVQITSAGSKNFSAGVEP
jgi:hypothetical protein